MSSNVEKLAYLAGSLFKVHLWNAGTDDEKFAQNNFIGRIRDAVVKPAAEAAAAKILDWEISLGGEQKTSLRTVLRWTAADFSDVKARIDAVSAQLAQTSNGTTLSREEQAAIYERAVRDALGVYEVRRLEPAALNITEAATAEEAK